MIGRWNPAALATSGLAVTLVAVGVSTTLAAERSRILTSVPKASPIVVMLLLVGAFAIAEVALLHVDLRRQTYSFSLSGTALLVGALSCDARALVFARVIGAVLVLGWQRVPPLKLMYNLGAYTLEGGLVCFGLHQILGSGIELTVPTAVTCYLLVGLVDLLMSSLVLLVITWHQGRVTGTEAVEVFGPAAVLSLFSTLSGVATVVLLDAGALGVVLIVGLATLTAVLYHGYLNLRNRHESLAVMHDFVEPDTEVGTAEELAGTLLARLRRLLGAGEAELLVHRAGGDLRMWITEGDVVSIRRAEAPTVGVGLSPAVPEQAVLIPQQTRDRELRNWLTTHDARDAMLVPLPFGGSTGTLIVKNRTGEGRTFTTNDLTLLQTLAGHFAVALRGAHLMQQLRHDATHDALTGLANRVLLAERIELAMRPRPAVPGERSAVLLLDLDKFKEVNDALGHHVGDDLLRVVGSRIRSCVPAEGTVARLGGDEFAVLLPGITEECPHPQVRQVADSVLAALAAPIELPGAVVSTRASIGIALERRGCDGADLLRHADTAMYAAKAGDAPVVIYSEELDHGRVERLTLLADLALALEHDELELLYQPQLDLHTGRVPSVEALVRWRHPEHGWLQPDDFIPLAESSGMIEDLTREVLGLALRQCRQWQDEGLDLVTAVNLSAYNVSNPNLVENVAASLAEAGLPADRLVLEITEGSVMGDPRRTVPILQRLADIGVTLSLDDFGTGYSSLAYLQKLPVREVKIDKSFITGLVGGREAHASSVLVRSIITLGGSLDLRVVAEGVETTEVLDLLGNLGCDVVQGYHIARPLTAVAVSDLVRSRKIVAPKYFSHSG